MIHETDTTRGAPATAGIPARADAKPAKPKGAKPGASKKAKPKAAKAKAKPAEAKSRGAAPSGKGPPPALALEVLGHGPGGALSEEDRAFLAEQEAIIESGAKSFLLVGLALIRIRDHRDGALWKAQYDTFQNYCRVRWGFGRQHAYRLMDAATVSGDVRVSPAGDSLPEPAREGQIRAIALLAERRDRAGAWARAVESHGPDPSGPQVSKVVRAMIRDGAPPRSEKKPAAAKPRGDAPPAPEAVPASEEKLLLGLEEVGRIMAALLEAGIPLSQECLRRSREFSRALERSLDAAEARARAPGKGGPPPDAAPSGGKKKGARR